MSDYDHDAYDDPEPESPARPKGVASSAIIGGAGAYKRHKSDHYNTPDDATQALLQHWWRIGLWRQVIWEPAVGDGRLADTLVAAGHDVIGSDIREDVPDVYSGGVDFLSIKELPADVTMIVTNPPFNRLAAKFIAHARTFGVPVAMIGKAQFWHAGGRAAQFEADRPELALALAWRIPFAPDRGDNPTMDFSWYCWGPDRHLPTEECAFRVATRPKGVTA